MVLLYKLVDNVVDINVKFGGEVIMMLHDFEREREAWVVEDRDNGVKFTRMVCASISAREYEVFIDSFMICKCCGGVVTDKCEAVMLDVIRLEKLLVNAVSVEELRRMQFNAKISATLAGLFEDSWWDLEG